MFIKVKIDRVKLLMIFIFLKTNLKKETRSDKLEQNKNNFKNIPYLYL